jgi:hypothetical protein
MGTVHYPGHEDCRKMRLTTSFEFLARYSSVHDIFIRPEERLYNFHPVPCTSNTLVFLLTVDAE